MILVGVKVRTKFSVAMVSFEEWEEEEEWVEEEEWYEQSEEEIEE